MVVFTIYLREDVNEDGTLKKGAAERVVQGIDGGRLSKEDEDEHDEATSLKEAREKLQPESGDFATHADDVD